MSATKFHCRELTLHGLTIVIIENDELLEWLVPGGTAADEILATRYLLEEGWLAEWFGADVVDAIINEQD